MVDVHSRKREKSYGDAAFGQTIIRRNSSRRTFGHRSKILHLRKILKIEGIALCDVKRACRKKLEISIVLSNVLIHV